MKLIYIAGKYRSDTHYGKYLNIRHAEEVAIKLWREGWAVLCPHLNTALFDDVYSDVEGKVWLAGGLEMLTRCDAIYLLKGWEESEGTRAEYTLAEELGLELLHET